MFGLLLILFTVVPAIEFYLLFTIGSQLGAMTTFLIIIATGVVGATLAKAQGLSIINKVQVELGSGQLPAKQLMHGFIVFGGGLLLLTPGFLTDALGFAMVIPGSRHIIVSFLSRYFEKGIASGNIKFMSAMNSNTAGGGFYYSSTSSNAYNVNDELFTQNENIQQEQPSEGLEDSNTIEAEFTKKH